METVFESPTANTAMAERVIDGSGAVRMNRCVPCRRRAPRVAVRSAATTIAVTGNGMPSRSAYAAVVPGTHKAAAYRQSNTSPPPLQSAGRQRQQYCLQPVKCACTRFDFVGPSPRDEFMRYFAFADQGDMRLDHR